MRTVFVQLQLMKWDFFFFPSRSMADHRARTVHIHTSDAVTVKLKCDFSQWSSNLLSECLPG